MDRLEKARKEVEKLHGNPYYMMAVKDVLAIIDSLQEQPVSIWHNMDEIPIKGEVILVQTKDTFYGISVQKGGTTYKNRNKDRYVRWAYASDLLNLSNVQRTVKDWKEEPVSENSKKHISLVTERMLKEGPIPTLRGKEKADFENEFNRFKQITGMINWPSREEIYKNVILWFIAWSRDHLKIGDIVDKSEMDKQPVSDELQEASEKCIKELIPEAELNSATPFALEYVVKLLHDTFKAGANWQKEKEYTCYEEAFEDGAKWQKEQDKETIELDEDHAMLAGIIKGTEHTIGNVRSILNKVAYRNNGLDVNGDYCEQPYVELDDEFKKLLKED